MQRTLYFSDGRVVAEPGAGPDAWVWVDAVGSDYDEVDRLARHYGFDRMSVLEVVNPTRVAQVSDHDSYTLINAHFLADDAERLRTIEVDLFVGPSFLVTFHGEELAALDWVRQQAASPEWLQGAGPDRVMSRILEVSAVRYRTLVDVLEDRVGQLEDVALAGDPQVVAEVPGLRRDAVHLRHVLRPQAEVVAELAEERFPGVGDGARDRLARAARVYARTAESLESVRGMLGAVLETHRSTVAERTNEIMKVLTVFAAMVLPMTLVAGIYGMNFANMPELDWRWGYFGALGFMALIGASLWVYFARRQFIGGPRLRPVTRVLGRGIATLVDLTTLPVRTMAGLILPHDRVGDQERGDPD